MKVNVDLSMLKIEQESTGIIYKNEIADISIVYQPTTWRDWDGMFDGEVDIKVSLDNSVHDTGGDMRYQFGGNLTLTCLEFCEEYKEMMEDAGDEDLEWIQVIIDVLKLEENMQIPL